MKQGEVIPVYKIKDKHIIGNEDNFLVAGGVEGLGTNNIYKTFNC